MLLMYYLCLEYKGQVQLTHSVRAHAHVIQKHVICNIPRDLMIGCGSIGHDHK